jgi:ATP-dependent DNA ligase
VMGGPGASTLDFAALLARIHPAASRIERLRRETPASFIAFDLLAEGHEDLRPCPFVERRRRLTRLLVEAAAPIVLTPATEDPKVAARWLRSAGGGVDGVVAKPADLPYEPGKRAMVKVKPQHTADCVVAGYRLYGGEGEPTLSSLLLGLYDADAVLRHVGVVGAFSAAERTSLLADLAAHVTPLAGHPWESGFGLEANAAGRLQGAAGRWSPDFVLDWVPLRPELVVEVAYDQLDANHFRHPARFRRWRPDRDPGSCTFDQFDEAQPVDVAALLAAKERV